MIPIYEMLEKYRGANPLPFHMPGHVLGRGLVQDLKAAGSLDITEIPGSDCLHSPHGVIREAQELAAKCFGADYTFFLVNGSTSGIHAMLQAALEPKDKIIIGRDCHVSVMNGLAQLNCEPVFVFPETDEESKIPLGVTAAALEPVIEANPDARALMITRPGYYGTAAKLDDISHIAEKYDIPLLVDEAHGAHFGFHEKLPGTAIGSGADLCVQSLHKTLPALTQTALLHGKASGRISRGRIEKTVSMVQTTSPSYILMASMDIARDMMEKHGRELYDRLGNIIDEFDRKLCEETAVIRFKCAKKEFENDFTRIVLNFSQTGISGFMAETILRTRFGIIAEMADLYNVVLIATPFHTPEDFDKLLSALKIMSGEHRHSSGCKPVVPPLPEYVPERVLPIREALFTDKRMVPVNEAAGEISGVYITPYPPGIPLVCPGERIPAYMSEYVLLLEKQGCPVHGVCNGYVEVI